MGISPTRFELQIRLVYLDPQKSFPFFFFFFLVSTLTFKSPASQECLLSSDKETKACSPRRLLRKRWENLFTLTSSQNREDSRIMEGLEGDDGK